MKTLKIVSRKSPLARIQALIVAEQISQSFPDIKIKHIYKKTLGDEDLNTPLNKMSDIGVFTNDIRNDLINKVADIAVHSWKDLPVDLGEGTEIVGTLDRADMRDMIFLKKESIGKKDLTILSSSPRREKNLTSFLPSALPFKTHIKFKDIRGNIHTRLTKLIEGNKIEVTNICRKHGFDGEISKITGKAWLVDPILTSKWEVQFIWPFTLDYWVIDLEENYNYAVIGEPDKENFWILSRKPIMEKGLLTKIIEKTKMKGYDLSNLILMPQDQRYSTCLTRWIKEDSEQNSDRPC